MNEKEFTDIQVILVEPSNTQQQIIKQYLIDLGINDIIWIENGNETLATLKIISPDLIISQCI